MVVVLIIDIMPLKVVKASAIKPKKGFYLEEKFKNHRLVIKKVKGNKITFAIGYSGTWEDGIKGYITVKINKKGEGKFRAVEHGLLYYDYKGIIKVCGKKKIKLKVGGGGRLVTVGWCTYKYINSNPDIDQIY